MTRASLVLAWLFALGLGACRCAPRTTVTDAELRVAPAELDFGRVYAGFEKVLTVTVSNVGRPFGKVAISTQAPFSVPSSELEVGGGESVEVPVRLSATEPQSLSGALKVGGIEVPLHAEVLAVPACESRACRPSVFDVATERCEQTVLADGAGCETSCLSQGTCSSGDCVGEAASCDDQNACTVDLCGASGCTHAPRECPPVSNPCLEPACDPRTGCGSEPVADGTLCGADDCLSTQVDICLSGQCVQRRRPDTGRCANTWVTTGVTSGPLAFDETRSLVVEFEIDTWTFDGQTWTRRSPAESPARRAGHAMTWDGSRRRVLLFGGADESGAPFEDTWEWDGVTWIRRTTMVQPRRRSFHSMTYDSARRRVVLFGGTVDNTQSGSSNETWEWDGRVWELRQPVRSPPETTQGSLAYDPVRRRVVLFGGLIFVGNGSQPTFATWEYDGTTWTRMADGPVRVNGKLAFDPTSRRVVLQGGGRQDGTPDPQPWLWDGTQWVASTATGPTRAQFVTDPRGGIVANGAEGTWRWDGARWARLIARDGPTSVVAAAYDADRQVVLCWDITNRQVWLWDGAGFTDAGFGPHDLRSPLAFFDEDLREVVVTGGARGDAGTWSWSGAQWSPRPSPDQTDSWTDSAAAVWDSRRHVGLVVTPFISYEYADGGWLNGPLQQLPVREGAVAFDRARGTPVLVARNGSTWERADGGPWLPTPADAGMNIYAGAATFDERSGNIVSLRSPAQLAIMRSYDGVAWRDVAPGKLPYGSFGGRLVYDRARARLTYFQGSLVWVYLPP